jgi:hypothetical protein
MLPCEWLKLTRPLGVIQRRGSSLGRTARGVAELILSENFDNPVDPKKSDAIDQHNRHIA